MAHPTTRDRITLAFQKRIANPVTRLVPLQTVLETTGRTSGLPRRTPIGGRRVGTRFWFVAEFGRRSQYVKNIEADPRVRLRLHGRWHTGIAHLLPEDNARARLKRLPTLNSAGVTTFGSELLTLFIDLD